MEMDVLKEPCKSCKVPRTKVRDFLHLLELECRCRSCNKGKKKEKETC